MSILIGALEFEGPVNLDELSNRAGVYGALCKVESEYELIHLGQAERMRNDVEQLPERSLWLESGIEVQWAVHYTGDELNEAERRELIEDLERELDDIEDEVGIEQIA
jgi:hypothetical protein